MGDAPTQFGYFTQSESIMKAYETDWKLYGIAELKTKIATYDACIKELKKNGYADGYNPLSGYEEAYFTQMHQKYLDYLNLKEQAEAALAERQAEYDAAKKPEIQEKRNQIAKDVLMENFGNIQDKYPAFTDKETYIIKSLYNQATYTNENIVITTLDSTSDAVDKAITLYKDAVEELYVESHPQYTYTDEIGNIYALPEFKEYHEQLAVNDFVRLGLSDTRYVKLRVVEITYNPCDMDESMEVTFSNMVQYKSKLTNDNEFLTNALNQTSNRNGGRVNSVNKSTTSDYVITADAIKQIFSNPLFNSMLGGAVTGGTGSGGTITADMIVAELVKAKEGVFDKLTVDTAFMKYLDIKLISADKITTRILEAEQANIEKLSAKIIESNEIYADMIDVKKIFAGNAGVGNLTAFNITAENVTIDEATVKELIAKQMTVGDLATQKAEAEEIILISKNNKPGIAFKESTQQFYDSAGNVRVQIGQDGNGDFNFIVRGEDGSTALFDSKGIKRDGIPESTIINEMIEAGTVSKDRLNFKINTNEQGGIDITEIYDGEGGKWGEQYTSFKDSTTEQIKNITDPEKGQIVTSISKAFFGEDGKTISDAYSMLTQTIDEIKTTISDNKVDADGKIEANTSSIIQNADKISFMVTGDKESEFTVTDKFIQMISDHISIDASTIDINGIITAMNTHTGPGKTKIDGGIIETNTITADSIKVDAIRSKIFEDDLTSNYSLKGIWFDLSENGAIKGKNFAVDSNGNAYIRGDSTVEGTIIANKGYIGGIGGFHIEAGKLYSGMDTFPEQLTSISKDKNVYIGTDGIALGSGNFRVDSNGKLYANSGEFSGTIYADGGTIGGWSIAANSLSNRDGSISLSPDGLILGNQLNIDNQGNAYFGGTLNAASGTFSGELQAAKGIFSGDLNAAGGTFEGTLNAVDGNFRGVLSGATGSFTGAVTATSLTLGYGVTIGASKVSGLADVATSGSYNDLDDVPEIPTDLEYYIKKDGTVGSEPSEGATGFKVSSDGLLQASNAIIYGEIVASSGKIGGFNISTKADNNDHAYKNTLYRIINGSDGYDYQAGIKGDSDSNTTIEAAFYVRKKLRNETWGDSTIPFFVRNDGYVYCENMSIGDSLYATGELSTKYDNLTTKFKIITAATDGVYFGLLDDTTKSRFSCHTKGMLYELGVDRPFSIAKDGNLTYSIKKQGSINVDLGASGVNYRYRNLYIEKIIFPDDSSMTTAKTSGDASSYGSLTNKPGINGHTLASGNNTLSDLGIAARSHSHSNSDINWSTTLGYKGFGHCHTMIYDGQGLKGISIAGSESPSYMGLIPYDVTYTNANSISLTRGGTMYLGAAYNSNKLTAYPFECGYFKNIKVYKGSGDASNIDNYITPSGGGSSLTGGLTIKLNGTSKISSWKGASDASVNITASSIGAATTSWVERTFGSKIDVSNGYLYLYNNNGSQLSSVQLPTSSGGGNYAPLYHTHDSITNGTNTLSISNAIYATGVSLGQESTRLKNAYFTGEIKCNSIYYNKLQAGAGSDINLKHNIHTFDKRIEEAYMDFESVSFNYNYYKAYDDEVDNNTYYGFIAQQIETSLNKHNISSETSGLVGYFQYDTPNAKGLTKEYYLSYLQFISLNTHMTQKAHHRIDSLESENQSLKNEILMLQGQLSLITQRLQKMEEKLC